MRIWDIITGKARRERKEAEERAARAMAAHAAARRDEDSARGYASREIERSRRYEGRAPGTPYRRGEVSETISPVDITSPLNPANPFYGTGYGVSGHHSAPDCSPPPSSCGYGGYGGGDTGGSCGGGDGGGGGGGGGGE